MFTKCEVFLAKYSAVERLIQEHFGFLDPFSIVACEETGNDCLVSQKVMEPGKYIIKISW